jgi:hypothetical protein
VVRFNFYFRNRSTVESFTNYDNDYIYGIRVSQCYVIYLVTITLNTQLDYKSNKVRISTGDTRNVFNEIDAVRLTGSLGKTVTPRRVDISYSDLEDKPTSKYQQKPILS